MVVKEDLIFRQVLTLRDGARVLLRPLVPDDRQALLDFFLPLLPEERRYMRHNVSDPALIASWAEKVDYSKVFPVIALIGDRIVGISTLHFGEGPARHRAEVRIFISKELKHRGLGSKLILAIIDLAKKRSIHLLDVQVVSDMVEVIKAFQKVGFEPVCTFEEYFILPDGELRDVVQLVLRLRRVEDEF